jgi:hypothetical protein
MTQKYTQFARNLPWPNNFPGGLKSYQLAINFDQFDPRHNNTAAISLRRYILISNTGYSP